MPGLPRHPTLAPQVEGRDIHRGTQKHVMRFVRDRAARHGCARHAVQDSLHDGRHEEGRDATDPSPGRRSSSICVLPERRLPGKDDGMSKILGVFGLVLTLATFLVAPAQEAYSAVSAITASAMQMDDGMPCPQQGCTKMPDCPIMVSCLPGFSALALAAADLQFRAALRALRFAVTAHPILPSLEGGGLRRPPKA